MRTCHRLLVFSFATMLAACASTASYPPDVARLEDDLIRIETDERIAAGAPDAVAAARAAVAAVIERRRRGDAAERAHAVYLAERLVAIAAAEGLARHAEERIRELSSERELLLIDARTREARARRDALDVRYAEERAEDDEPEDDEPEDE